MIFNRLLKRIANNSINKLEEYNDGPGELIPFKVDLKYDERFIWVNNIDINVSFGLRLMHDDMFKNYCEEHNLTLKQLYQLPLAWGYITSSKKRILFISGTNININEIDTDELMNKTMTTKIYYFDGPDLINLENKDYN